MASGDENNTISVSEYLRELKTNISTWEDIVLKSQKLNVNLKSVSQSASSVIDSIGILCKAGHNNVAGIGRVTQLLSEITVMERYVSDKICVLNKAVQDNLVVNISQELESWRRSVYIIKRDREIDGRKAKSEYKKSLAEVIKLEKKINKRSSRKQSLSDTMSLQADYANQDLQNKEHFVEELERCVLRKAICEERSRYRRLVECLRPVLEAQLSMREDFDTLQRIYDELYSEPLSDLNAVPGEVETFVRQYQVSEQSRANSFSSVYSRANSQLSLAPSSSRSSSIDDDHNITLPPDNLDTSTSTLHDPNNESVLQSTKETLDQPSDNDQDSLRPVSTDGDTLYADATLYPNQALPPPRYSNLRQLKQNAEKKYGLGTLSRDAAPQYNHQSMPRQDMPSSHYSDCTFSREPSQCIYEEGLIMRTNAPSHYSDCTITRNTNLPREASGNSYKADNDIYATISQVYGTTAALFSDVNSGTTTFKRRKPSNVTAMDAPSIMDKRIFYPPPPPLSNDIILRRTDEWRNQRIVNGDRNHAEGRYSMDLSTLPGYSSDKNHLQNNFIGDTPVVAAARTPSSRNSSVGRDTNPSRFNNGDSVLEPHSAVVGKRSADSTMFKQQLLQVIQTGRGSSSYQKPVGPSHMF